MRGRSGGFTLIELAVAILIVAIIAAIGYGTMDQALKSRGIIKEQQQQLLALQNTVRILEQDFVQAAPRPVRQAVGDDPPQLAFVGAPPGTQPLVALTRAGWANPKGLQRPGLQRVAYYFENGTLRREHWNVLDPTLASTTVKHELMQHVKTFSLRYLDVNHNWQPQWPPATSCQGCASQEQALRQRPLAVEITLETDDWGKVVRIIEIAS
jgi:general secretion pathway protein J